VRCAMARGGGGARHAVDHHGESRAGPDHGADVQSEREPFKSWKNLPTFWSRMIEVPGVLYSSTDYYQNYGQSPDGVFGAMIDSRQVHKLPIGWLLLLLIVYLGVIGRLISGGSSASANRC